MCAYKAHCDSMEIIRIQENILYSVKYDNSEFDEYNRIFEDYENPNFVLNFFESYKWQIGNFYVMELGIPQSETEAYAKQVIDEVYELEDHFENLIDNSSLGLKPDLFSHFTTLEGFENEDLPAMKSYGLKKPSLLRVYAIEVDRSCLIIFNSGIKIRKSLSECPILKDNVLSKARNVIDYLTDQGVTPSKHVDDIAK